MKKVFCVILVVISMMTVCAFADTARNYESAEDFMARYDCRTAVASNDIFMEKIQESTEAAVEYLRESLGLEENEETMALPLKEGDYSKLLVLIYDKSERDIPKMDRTILRAFLFELV